MPEFVWIWLAFFVEGTIVGFVIGRKAGINHVCNRMLKIGQFRRGSEMFRVED